MTIQQANILLVHDSIGQGYEPYLNTLLGKTVQSTGQNNDSGCVVGNIANFILSKTFDVLVINCGLHDLQRINGPGTATLVAQDQYSYNLISIFNQTFGCHPQCKILFVSSTPTVESKQTSYLGKIQFANADIAAYNTIASGIITGMINGYCADINTLEITDHPLLSDTTADGIHGTAARYSYLAQYVYNALVTVVAAQLNTQTIINDRTKLERVERCFGKGSGKNFSKFTARG